MKKKKQKLIAIARDISNGTLNGATFDISRIISITQYGFRPAKNTAHAIYVIRWIQNYAETTRVPSFLTLIDWEEKTFDKVDHKCLCEELERIGIDAHMIQALKDGYAKAIFSCRTNSTSQKQTL